MAGALAAGGRLGGRQFVFAYLCICICVFVHLYMCICICPALAKQQTPPDELDAQLPPVVLAAVQEQEQEQEQEQLQKPWT
jgi:hypothetical protein